MHSLRVSGKEKLRISSGNSKITSHFPFGFPSVARLERLPNEVRLERMITELVYWFCKVYFSVAGIFFIYSWYVNDLQTFGYVTGIISVIFLLSNIKWYFFKH